MHVLPILNVIRSYSTSWLHGVMLVSGSSLLHIVPNLFLFTILFTVMDHFHKLRAFLITHTGFLGFLCICYLQKISSKDAYANYFNYGIQPFRCLATDFNYHISIICLTRVSIPYVSFQKLAGWLDLQQTW
jgi:hypothetical protein